MQPLAALHAQRANPLHGVHAHSRPQLMMPPVAGALLPQNWMRLHMQSSTYTRTQCARAAVSDASAPSRPQRQPPPARPNVGPRAPGGGRGFNGRGRGSSSPGGRGGSSGGRGYGGRGPSQQPQQQPQLQQQQQQQQQQQSQQQSRPSQGGAGLDGQSSGMGGQSRMLQGNSRGKRADDIICNGMIRAHEVRVLGGQKQQLGVMSLEDAAELAEEQDVDVVMVSPDAEPPVVRLIDVSKYKFETEKLKRQAAKKSKAQQADMKELKVRPNTEEHDYQVRLKAAIKFLSRGDKVKFSCHFKGREMEFKDIGSQMFQRFIKDLEANPTTGDIQVVSRPRMMGSRMLMVVGRKAAE